MAETDKGLSNTPVMGQDAMHEDRGWYRTTTVAVCFHEKIAVKL